jgi:spore maturation protein CgeB
MIVKASGVGVFDSLLEQEILAIRRKTTLTAFWDVDAPATLDSLDQDASNPFAQLIPQYDFVFTYGGGQPVIEGYEKHGARICVPIYNALDPETHHPVEPDSRYSADLSFLGNRLPDREARVEEFFLRSAQLWPEGRFLLGGSGWGDKPRPENVSYVDFVPPTQHNAFNVSSKAVLNISRESMARYGFSPATRVFEAVGAAACLITDAWRGIELFLEPGSEVLVANDGNEVAELARDLDPRRAKLIGERAQKRVLAEHTYAQRALQFENVLTSALSGASK